MYLRIFYIHAEVESFYAISGQRQRKGVIELYSKRVKFDSALFVAFIQSGALSMGFHSAFVIRSPRLEEVVWVASPWATNKRMAFISDFR